MSHKKEREQIKCIDKRWDKISTEVEVSTVLLLDMGTKEAHM